MSTEPRPAPAMPEPEIHSHAIRSSGLQGAEGDPSVRFPYWSFTKTVIAICALKMSEDGALDLDARWGEEPYTLRQLLAHTAGLPDYGRLAQYHRAVADREPPWPREKLLDLVLADGLLFKPGAGWSYSNVGYMLAKERIEAAAGQDFSTLLSDMICKPLGLESIELATTKEQFAGLHWPEAAGYDPGWVYHSCLIGNAPDAARLLHALFQGRLLKRRSLDAMLEDRPLGGTLPGRPWTAHGYGLGLMIGTTGISGRAIGHSGGGPFCVNAVYHFPDRDDPVTVASFTKGSDEGIAEWHAARLA